MMLSQVDDRGDGSAASAKLMVSRHGRYCCWCDVCFHTGLQSACSIGLQLCHIPLLLSHTHLKKVQCHIYVHVCKYCALSHFYFLITASYSLQAYYVKLHAPSPLSN